MSSARLRTWMLAAAMILVAAVGVFFLVGAVGCADADRLVIEPRALTFGRVVFGLQAQRTITLRNESERDVVIARIEPNCACLRVEPTYDRVLRPDESTVVTVTLITTAITPQVLRGKRITVVTDDAVEAHTILEVEAEIVPLWVVTPRVVRWNANGADPQREHVVRVRPGPGFRLQVVSATAQHPESVGVEVTAAETGYDVRLSPAGTGVVTRSAVHLVLEAEGEGLERPLRLPETIEIKGN
jgi:hypothetical protein